MAVCYAAMPSYTYAMKAQRMLSSKGISSEVKRSEKASGAGCGYSLYIKEKCGGAVEILKKNSIPYTEISYGGV
ncbi:MAG: DUF3343 domain-containing protein [Ruminococcus sp.]|nr:DUF3343 domain-containing protein [Ruminococcus sp.]MCD7812030.1 DUF3343 domain-containing protein [Ruminococcus sp.]